VDTVTGGGLACAARRPVIAATTAEPIPICLNLGGGGIRGYPPGRQAGIVTPGSPTSPLRSTRPSAS